MSLQTMIQQRESHGRVKTVAMDPTRKAVSDDGEVKMGGCPMHRLFERVEGASFQKRLGILGMGIIGYAMFLVAILYAIGFVANLIVPKGIDSGAVGPTGLSLLINTMLLSVFVVQHTVMARPIFKKWFTQYVPSSMERSIFVAAASASLMLVFWQWKPLPTAVWEVDHPILHWALVGVSMAGWGIVFASSFMISHFDLFGLRQSLMGFLGRPCKPVPFRLVGLYRLVRHPLMVGFLVAVWATPVMSVGHLFFAAMITAYIFVGTVLEERDLIGALGEQYLEYREQVRGFIPIPKRRRRGSYRVSR